MRITRTGVAVIAATAAIAAVVAPNALAYGTPIAPPANLAPTKSAAVISTAVNGLHIVRANLADKFIGDRFIILVNGKIVARGKVHARGRFLTWFRRTVTRGTIIEVRVVMHKPAKKDNGKNKHGKTKKKHGKRRYIETVIKKRS